MNIEKRLIVIITAFILVLISGCATVSRESNAPMERQERDQSQTQQQPSPSITGEMEDAEQQKKNKGSDDMERLD